ncbi:hypothetical protein [Glaciimonas immobilis]|uniref:Uncharacterized protein n=1 Tax=Glaciimonas immobilis TaxID=728004 RepID=A0A840RWK6_9BURK|nr:hypothetical protein [Glaciimonas immobilis]KAF3998347.1 hypothetical protein HAV38_09105 [Glaciimonas immobilis]MBB5201973.1 hypothetical protein [Glaciimonas immobilis]
MLSLQYPVQNSYPVSQAITHRQFVRWLLALAAFSTVFFASAIHAAGNNPDADAAYQRQRTACTNGSSNQNRATCLREAGAALQAAKQGQLADTPSQYDKNRLERCNVLPEKDRPDCISRMQPGGVVDGSARSGGILRESVMTEVGPPIVIQPPDTAKPSGSQ